MIKKILTLAIAGLAAATAGAQKIEVKEPAILEVLFTKYADHDTLNHLSKNPPAEMGLRIGKSCAMFYPVKKLFQDSLMHYNKDLFFELDRRRWEEEKKTGVWNPIGGREWEYIYKNMPEGKWTVTNYFDMEGHIYEEPIEVPQWELLDSVKTVIGYECQLAQTDFRGRRWLAWFTTEIPIGEGPWKLSGLPGLILEAYDSAGHYRFEATGMLKNNANVGFFIFRDNFPTTRDAYLKARYNCMPRPGKQSLGDRIKAMGIVKNTKAEKPTDEKKKIYPHYDFEETNYPH